MLSKEAEIKQIFYSSTDKLQVCQQLVQALFADRYEDDFLEETPDDNIFNNIFALAVEYEDKVDERIWHELEEWIKKL